MSTYDLLRLVGWAYAVLFAVLYLAERRHAKQLVTLNLQAVAMLKHNTDEWFRATHQLIANHRADIHLIAEAAGVNINQKPEPVN